ncbi:MAG: hypothetical protein ACRD9W_17000, partial [Terriglobia bacterium]
MIRVVASALLQVALLGALACVPAHAQSPTSAQSEFLGERFPYQAFDRLPATPVTVGGATLNVGFA